MSIIIFSRPVHSGKTTELLEWCKQQPGIAGILMPDIDGHRNVLDLRSNETFPIQCANPEQAEDEPLTVVGKFHFYSKAFERANMILIDTLESDPEWLVIDEAGKLELEGKGFYPSIKRAAELYTNEQRQGNLLITVRESLCNEVIRFLGLKDYMVVHDTKDIAV